MDKDPTVRDKQSVAIWDFAEKKQPNDCPMIERMVTDIYALFWEGKFATTGLKLLQDNGNKPGPETFDMLTRFDLAEAALGEKEFHRLGEQKACEFLVSWNMADYRKINYHYAYYFVRGKSVESESASDNKESQYKRGLGADEAELEQWYLNWSLKIVAKAENQQNKKSISKDFKLGPDLSNAIAAIASLGDLGSFRLDKKVEKIQSWCKAGGKKAPGKRTIETALARPAEKNK